MFFTELPCPQTLQSWQLFSSLSLFPITIPRSLIPPGPMCLGESHHHHYLLGFVEENELGHMKCSEPILWMTDVNNRATGAWAGLPSTPFQFESNWAYFPRTGHTISRIAKGQRKGWAPVGLKMGLMILRPRGKERSEKGRGQRAKALMPVLITDPESSSVHPGTVGCRTPCHPSLNASFLKHLCMSMNQIRNSWQIQSPSRPFHPRNLPPPHTFCHENNFFQVLKHQRTLLKSWIVPFLHPAAGKNVLVAGETSRNDRAHHHSYGSYLEPLILNTMANTGQLCGAHEE